MKLLEQIQYEDDIPCVIYFEVNADGTLEYDREQWSKVEPKIRAGWAKSVNVFDILCTVNFTSRGWISKFSLEVDKKKPHQTLPIKPGDVKVKIFGDEVVAEFGGVVNKNINEIISDIRTGYLPCVMEDFENSDITQLMVDECYAQLRLTNCKEAFETALSDLKEVQKKLEEYKNKGGNFYGK